MKISVVFGKLSSFTFYLTISLFLFLGIPVEAQVGSSVVGCGGFIRWHSPAIKLKIDYQLLKVNLYVTEGDALKDVTEVLPNGAFSVPLYDQGSYRLKLAAPEGWHFSPANGYLLDLRANPQACTSDFNFELLGFTVTGQVVTFGLATGPEGLLVRFISALDKSEVHTRTTTGGRFSLGPVIPGDYTLTVSDGEAAAPENIRAQQSVSVAADHLVLEKPVILLGHFVRGYVTDFVGKPLSGVSVFLLTTNSTLDTDCTPLPEETKRQLQLPSNINAGFQLTCETITDNSGQFSFNRLPGGDYIILPRHNFDTLKTTNPSALFAFEPEYRLVTVAHTDIQLGPDTFQAARVQLLPGRLTWPNGQPLAGAKISLASTDLSCESDRDGFYQFGFVRPQQYIIRVKTPAAEFTDLPVEITPETEKLPDIQPARLSVCGLLDATDDLIKRHDQVKVFVQIKTVKSGEIERVPVSLQSDGYRFCTFLTPSQYEIRPEVHFGSDNSQSAFFVPASRVIDVSAGPVNNLVFSQFTATLSGRVSCLVSCSTFVVQLTPAHSSNTPSNLLQTSVKLDKKTSNVGYFEFADVYPGDYRISVMITEEDNSLVDADGWCWSRDGDKDSGISRLIHVEQNNLHWKQESALDFVQSGFAFRVLYEPPSVILSEAKPDLVFSASEQTTPASSNHSSDVTQLHWRLNERAAKICLPSANSIYVLSATSPCVKVDQPSPSRIQPARDCASPVLARSPLVRVSVAQTPLLIQLAYMHPFVPADRVVLTKSPIQVDVTQPADQAGAGTTRKIMAQWMDEGPTPAPPMARAVVWIDSHKSVLIKPRIVSAVPHRWFYTHLIHSNPVTLDAQRATNDLAEPPVDLFKPVPVATAEASFQAGTLVRTPQEFAQCASMYHTDLTVRFNLDLGVTLYGETQPAVSKAEVKLYAKPHGKPSAPSPSQPLLPIHPTPTNASVEGETPASVSDEQVTAADSMAQTPLEIVITDVDGTFLFGPVPLSPQLASEDGGSEPIYRLPADPTECFDVELRKPGYEFAPSTQKSAKRTSNWQFKATRLSLVEVLVRHADEQDASKGALVPLQGVLISIIGEGHRGNQFTDKFGLAHFVGLAPGQYYLRPMMKEYLFTMVKPKVEQAGQASPITISEGLPVHVEVVAKRVAFSLSGLVTSLSRLPEPNVLVEAEWIAKPSSDLTPIKFPSTGNSACPLNADGSTSAPREQAWTNDTGHFQIRGLFPGCTYAIRVHTGSVDAPGRGSASANDPEVSRKSTVERSIPDVSYVVMAPYDADGLSFFAVRPFYLQTLTVNVDTADEFLPTLRLSLFPLDRPDRVVVKHDFSEDSMLFSLTGPKLASIVGHDHVLRLESTLESRFYTNVSPQEMVVRLRPGKSEHLRFTFHPELRARYPDSLNSKTEL